MNNYKHTLLLLTFIVLQGCTAYNKTSMTLEQATNKGKVKITNNAGQFWKFDRMYSEEGKFYGINKEDTVQIAQNHISELHLIDLEKSDKRTKITKWTMIAVGGVAATLPLIGILYTFSTMEILF